MKLTNKQIDLLKKMAWDEMPNAKIAKTLGIPVADVHATRSRLGITRAKVATAKGKPGMTINPDFEAAVKEMDRQLAVKKAVASISVTLDDTGVENLKATGKPNDLLSILVCAIVDICLEVSKTGREDALLEDVFEAASVSLHKKRVKMRAPGEKED